MLELAAEYEWRLGALTTRRRLILWWLCDAMRCVVCDSGGIDCGVGDGEDVRERESEERDDGEILGGLGADDDEMDGWRVMLLADC
jgi:hypothetical protein